MQKLHPKAVWLFFFRFLGIGFALLIVLGWIGATALVEFMMKGFGQIALVLGLFFVVWILFSSIGAKLSYNVYKYELAENAFKKEHGVIQKRYVSIPYERIQNVDIHRGILARILGLSDLMIQTAGYTGGGRGVGREPEGRLPGISREVAEQLREELITKAKGVKQGL